MHIYIFCCFVIILNFRFGRIYLFSVLSSDWMNDRRDTSSIKITKRNTKSKLNENRKHLDVWITPSFACFFFYVIELKQIIELILFVKWLNRETKVNVHTLRLNWTFLEWRWKERCLLPLFSTTRKKINVFIS
jgi:hypothetical protein